MSCYLPKEEMITAHMRCYLPKEEIKDYNVIIDGKNVLWSNSCYWSSRLLSLHNRLFITLSIFQRKLQFDCNRCSEQYHLILIRKKCSKFLKNLD